MALQNHNDLDSLLRLLQEAGDPGFSRGCRVWTDHQPLPKSRLHKLREVLNRRALDLTIALGAAICSIGSAPSDVPFNQGPVVQKVHLGPVAQPELKQQRDTMPAPEVAQASAPKVAQAPSPKAIQPQKRVQRTNTVHASSSHARVAVSDQPDSLNYLDQSIIRYYVHQSYAQIKYCYEKVLIAKPTLVGTVQARFLITPDGTVAESTASGVDGEVASCVAGVIKQIAFPRSGGPIQIRSYPFRFVPDRHPR